MKRSDRQLAILIFLQQRPETAQSLAEKLEVSKRTIIRDMNALSEMGIPLYAITGPSGGYRLMDGYKLPPLQFDYEEGLAILLSLGAMTKMADTPFNQARWTAIDKVRAIMPERILQQVEPVLKHMEIDVPTRHYKTPYLEDLLKYAAASTWVYVHYRSEKHQRWLQLLPGRVYSAYGFWYCEAYSIQHKENRTFRVDRFDQIEPIEPPSIDAIHDGIKTDKPIDASPSIRLVARLTYRGSLIAEQDPHIEQNVKQITDEEWELDFMCPAAEWAWAVRFFFMLGLDAEVLEPLSLKHEIFQIVNRLCDRYRST